MDLRAPLIILSFGCALATFVRAVCRIDNRQIDARITWATFAATWVLLAASFL